MEVALTSKEILNAKNTTLPKLYLITPVEAPRARLRPTVFCERTVVSGRLRND